MARSGQVRSGQFRSGDVSNWGLTVHINGVDQSLFSLKRSLTITDSMGSAPSEAALTVRTAAAPSVGHTVEVYNGGYGTGVPYFRGRITTIGPFGAKKRVGGVVRYPLNCTDWTWDLNRYRVTARYDNLGINSILARLLAAYSEGGFTVGYAPASLGTLNQIEFSGASLVDAIDQLAGRVSGGAYWTCDYDRRVSIIPASEQDPSLAGSTVTVTNGDGTMRPEYTEDLTETFTRVIAVGGGSETTAVTSAASTTITVAELGWYSSAGGSFQANNQTGTYTGVSGASGAGNLTGVSGLSRDIPIGTSIRPRHQADDAAAQTALAALVGGAGVRELHYSNETLDDAGVRLVAAAALAIRKSKFVSFTYEEEDDPVRNLMAGKTISVSYTGNIPVSITSGRVQQVKMVVVGAAQASAPPKVYRQVTVAPLSQGLIEYLDKLAISSRQVI